MNVWIVRGENCFSDDGEVAWLEGVYATEALAETAAQAVRKEQRKDGRRVYELLCQQEEAGKQVDTSRWDVSIMVEKHKVQDA